MRTLLFIVLLASTAYLPLASAFTSTDEPYHVGPNLMWLYGGAYANEGGYRQSVNRSASPTVNVLDGTNITNMSDGNFSSMYVLQPSSGHNNQGACRVTNVPYMDIRFATPSDSSNAVDFTAQTFYHKYKTESGPGGNTVCLSYAPIRDGSVVEGYTTQTNFTDSVIYTSWFNFSSTVVLDGIRVYWGNRQQPDSNSYQTLLRTYEFGIFSRNSSYYPLNLSYPMLLSTYATRYQTGTNTTDYSLSHAPDGKHLLNPGTYTMLLATAENRSKGFPMQWLLRCYSSPSVSLGTCSPSEVSFHTDRITPYPDFEDTTGITGDSCRVQMITVTVTTARYVGIFDNSTLNGNAIRPAYDDLCVFGTNSAMLTSDRSQYKYTINTYDWSGSNTDATIGYIFSAELQNYPWVPGVDSDLSPTSTSTLFNLNNITQGQLTFTATPSTGNSFTIGLPDARKFAFIGNAIIIGLTQAKPNSANAEQWELLINNNPASFISSWETANHEGAFFYVDDFARRNDLEQAINGSVMTGNWRPFGQEIYQFQLAGSGWDSSVALKNVALVGEAGHAMIGCDPTSICYANLQTTLNLPENQRNVVSFYINNTNGTLLEDVRIKPDINTTNIFTNSVGFAQFNSTYQTVKYTITKSGYSNTCVRFYFISVGTPISGTDTDGCPFIRAYNATFSLTLLTPEEAGTSGNGSFGSSTSNRSVTISPNPGNFTVPDPAVFTLLKNFDEPVYWAVFRVQSSGLPTLRTQIYPITNRNDTIRYPLNGPTIGTVGVSNHTGQYYLTVVDESSVVLAQVPFIICPSSTTCQSQPSITAAINLSTSAQIETQLSTIIVDESTGTSPELETKNVILQAADYAYGDMWEGCGCFLEIPRMYAIFFLALGIAIFAIIVKRRNGEA